jgi:hypothetical protein
MANEGGSWLTYSEAGHRFGVSAEAARQLAKRRGWQRRTPNEPNEPARIFVPDDAYVRPRTPINGGHAPINGVDQSVNQPAPNGDDRPFEQAVRAFEIAIATLATQVDRADERARLERERADRLKLALADAVAAERIAAGDAAALRAEADRRRSWSLGRRLLWALFKSR